MRDMEKNNFFFFSDIYDYLGISHDSFYRFFPKESERYESLKKGLFRNRIKTKVSLRMKLHKSNSTAANLALYKLIATPEERRALSMEYKDITTNGENVKIPVWMEKLED